MSDPDAGSPAAEPLDMPRPPTTFVVRITVSLAGELAGNVQRVRTGERRVFHRTEAIGALIAEMLASGETHGGGDMPVKRAPPADRVR